MSHCSALNPTNQWTESEKFPRFMEGVTAVRQLDDTHLYWRASIGERGDLPPNLGHQDFKEFIEARGRETGWRGSVPATGWLSWRVGLEPGAARALGTLPRLTKALGRGELSYAQVRALTRVATPETEERLLAVGRAGTAVHVERSGRRRWRWWWRLLYTRTSTRARRPSATRWSYTSTPRYWPIQISLASQSSRTAPTFPRERRVGWRVTRAGW